MNNFDLILIALIIILAAILISFVIRYNKLKSTGGLSTSKQVNEFSKLIISLTTNVMKLNNLSQESFDNDEQFRKELAGLVLEELNATITNEDIQTKYKFISELSDRELEQLIINIFALYKKEIGIMDFVTNTAQSIFNEEKREPRLEEPVKAPVFEDKVDTGKVDISTELSKFNE